jgi:hypothetical protein
MAVERRMDKPSRAPLMKNATAAPFVYFDNVPSCGIQPGGMIEVELAGRIIMPQAEGQATVDMVCVAHLRCTAPAAMALQEAVGRAVQMLQQEMQDRMAAQQQNANLDKIIDGVIAPPEFK